MAARRKGMKFAVAYGDCGTFDAFFDAEQIPLITGPYFYGMLPSKGRVEAEVETALGIFCDGLYVASI